MSNISYSGIITALITPFMNDKLDLKSWENLIKNQIKSGINGVVVAGSTGESFSLSDNEKHELLHSAKDVIKNKIPIIMGINTNYHHKTIEQINRFKEADAFLLCTPYYVKPSQIGIQEYYTEISKYTTKDIIIYNVPSRTAFNLDIDSAIQLLSLPNVIGLKDAVQDISRASIIKNNHKDKYILSGDDASFFGYILYGGDGVISVLSNLIPNFMSTVYQEWKEQKLESVQKNLMIISAINQSLDIASNPVPIKHAMSKLYHYIQKDVRLPLVTLDKEQIEILEKTLDDYIFILDSELSLSV
ncbi:4-hydroxy-tetrahydrodipicolinate synthase [Anaplasmataceae bacterium AB001_6]|nr:4-hydroxy-tetrahydrodipicolinate synthase [Anaplasmataceae bacterium AB001_6]